VKKTESEIADSTHYIYPGGIMKRKFIFLLGVMMVFTLGCGMINSLIGVTESAGTVSELWPDVPPLEGATKADLEIPLAFQLMIKAIAKGGVNYIAFTTPKTPDEIKGFYTAELMQTNGWQAVDMEGNEASQQSCVGNQADTGNAGAFCMFSKKEGDKDTLLAIIIAQDNETKQTSVFYARVDSSGIDLQLTPPPQGIIPSQTAPLLAVK
jgi:hypothetical protein